MTPHEFIDKWSRSDRTERQAAQEHFHRPVPDARRADPDRADLDRAYQQLQLYSVALENPLLLVVSDTKCIRIYTNRTNTVQERHEFPIEDLAHSGTRDTTPRKRAADACYF